MKKYLALKADAGSGKTFALSVRFVALILQGEKIQQILAITFTNKATNEMKSRIISIFSDIANSYGKSFEELKNIRHFEELKALSKMLKFSQNESENLAQITKIAHQKLDEFMSNELRIMTFDSFFTMILRQFSLNLGLMPDFKTGEDIQNELVKHIQTKFNDNQIKDIVSLIKYSQSNQNKVFKAIDEIFKVELNKPLCPAPNIDFATKFNEIVDLWNEAVQNGSVKSGTFKIQKITQNRKKDAKYVVDRIFIKTINKFDEPNFVQKIEDLKNLMREYFAKFEAYKIANTLNLVGLYAQARKQVAQNTNKMSFGDATNLVYELLCKNKISVDWLYFKLDADIKNILIDEFQDTSVYHYKIMLPLINEIVSGLGQNGVGSFFYVGDIKQSIYGFRNAKKEIFDALSSKFKQIQVDSLDTNYRSKSVIVDFVNNTFKDKIKGFNQDQKSIKSGGFVEICDFEISTEDKDFLNLLLKKVQFFIKNGVLPSDIAILCRKNEECIWIKDFLAQNGIDAYINAKNSLIDTMPVRLVLEYLRYCLFGDEGYVGALEVVLGKQFAKLNLEIKDIPSTLKYLANQLGLDEFEPNLMKLYEISLEYENIIDFVYEIEKNETISANLIQNGVNVMTIHKCKGLEFETVIVCDYLGRKSNDKSQFLTNYDTQTDTWKIRLKDEAFKTMEDKDYLDFKDKIESLQKDEILNSLYVAFTRAKNSLTILVRNNANGNYPSCLRNYKTSKGEVLAELNLQNGKFGKFEPNLTIQKPNLELNLKDELKPFEIVAKQDISKEKEIDLQENIENIYFGNALHFMLEMSKFDEQSNKTAFHALTNKFGAFLSQKQLENIKFRVENLTKDAKFNEIIANKKIFKEQNISFDEELYRVDLLCMNDDEIVVLDYKSGQILDLHIEQVSKYKKILANLYPQKNISGFVVSLQENGIKFKEV